MYWASKESAYSLVNSKYRIMDPMYTRFSQWLSTHCSCMAMQLYLMVIPLCRSIDHTCRIFVVVKVLTLSRKDITRKTLTKIVACTPGKVIRFFFGKMIGVQIHFIQSNMHFFFFNSQLKPLHGLKRNEWLRNYIQK